MEGPVLTTSYSSFNSAATTAPATSSSSCSTTSMNEEQTSPNIKQQSESESSATPTQNKGGSCFKDPTCATVSPTSDNSEDPSTANQDSTAENQTSDSLPHQSDSPNCSSVVKPNIHALSSHLRPDEKSVVRLSVSQIAKMEYPSSSEDNQNLHHNIGSVECSVILPQQVLDGGVIKTVPTMQQSHMLGRPDLGHQVQLIAGNAQEQSVLAEMVNMQAYDQYQRLPSSIYSKVYGDQLSNAAAMQQYLPPLTTHNLLHSGYPNLMPAASSAQDSYFIHNVPRSDYYSVAAAVNQPGAAAIRYGGAEGSTDEIMERLSRVNASGSLYKPVTVDLPSPPDSGLGHEMITPKQEIHSAHHMQPESQFTYNDLTRSVVQELVSGRQHMPPTLSRIPMTPGSMPQMQEQLTPNGCNINCNSSLSGRDTPVHIPKIITSLGFQYTLEGPISTSVRKEDDQMTYVNKGQFYTVSLEYIPDPNKPLKSNLVKSVLMVVFRDDRTYEEDLKSWTFWHSRQHSTKQRILEVDSKNCLGVLNSIDEIAHNAVSFYWNTQEQPVKVNVAVQCLSTDFSNQKGVKGLPLHLQIDTFDELQSKLEPFHRGYAQIKVFCDKGAERKLRDEERRAFKRRISGLEHGANRKMLHEQRREEKRRIQGRKKNDIEYHEPNERSEFYHMSNLSKPAVLFIPPEDYGRFPPLDSFYSVDMSSIPVIASKAEHSPTTSTEDVPDAPTAKKPKILPSDRTMIYVRRPDDQVFCPLHLAPPSREVLISEVCKKCSIDTSAVTEIYRQNRKGITATIDDDMVRHYCNEDVYVVQLSQDGEDKVLITLVELVPADEGHQ